MAVPAAHLLPGPPQAGQHHGEQFPQQLQRQLLAGLAVGRAGEGEAGQVDQVADGRVAVEHLEQEQIDGVDRPELPLAEGMADLAADAQD